MSLINFFLWPSRLNHRVFLNPSNFVLFILHLFTLTVIGKSKYFDCSMIFWMILAPVFTILSVALCRVTFIVFNGHSFLTRRLINVFWSENQFIALTISSIFGIPNPKFEVKVLIILTLILLGAHFVSMLRFQMKRPMILFKFLISYHWEVVLWLGIKIVTYQTF